MADFFAKLSEFWNAIVGDMQNMISAFNPEGGGIFNDVKNLVSSLLGKLAEGGETKKAE